jgi:hypothetical protein
MSMLDGKPWRWQYIPAPIMRLRSELSAKMKIPAETFACAKLRLRGLGIYKQEARRS